MPSCWCREVAFVPFVLIRPVRWSIDGGSLSGLACRSPGPARSPREEDVVRVAYPHPLPDLQVALGPLCVRCHVRPAAMVGHPS